MQRSAPEMGFAHRASALVDNVLPAPPQLTLSIQYHRMALADRPCWRAKLAAMTRLDDLRLSSQELIYLATGARLLAAQARSNAQQQQSTSVRSIFENAERVYLELAAKCERLSRLIGSCA